MDENKNWIDYRYFNPNKTAIFIKSAAAYGGNTSLTTTCTWPGLYLALATTRSSEVGSFSTTGNVLKSVAVNYGRIDLIRASENDTISQSISGYGYAYAVLVVYYLNGFSSFVSGFEYNLAIGNNASATNSYGYTDGLGNILFGVREGHNSLAATENIVCEGQNITTNNLNGGGQHLRSFVAISESNNASCTWAFSGGSHSSSIIGYGRIE